MWFGAAHGACSVNCAGKVEAWFRRNHIRFRAHYSPYNSGLTAGEALVAPFFGGEEPAPTPLGVPLGDLFPRSACVGQGN